MVRAPFLSLLNGRPTRGLFGPIKALHRREKGVAGLSNLEPPMLNFKILINWKFKYVKLKFSIDKIFLINFFYGIFREGFGPLVHDPYFLSHPRESFVHLDRAGIIGGLSITDWYCIRRGLRGSSYFQLLEN